jgi:predicted HTH transcriptional regulator
MSSPQNKLDEFSKKIAKEIVAFANSFGGTLFVGIADDKTKVGGSSICQRNDAHRKMA